MAMAFELYHRPDCTTDADCNPIWPYCTGGDEGGCECRRAVEAATAAKPECPTAGERQGAAPARQSDSQYDSKGDVFEPWPVRNPTFRREPSECWQEPVFGNEWFVYVGTTFYGFRSEADCLERNDPMGSTRKKAGLISHLEKDWWIFVPSPPRPPDFYIRRRST